LSSALPRQNSKASASSLLPETQHKRCSFRPALTSWQSERSDRGEASRRTVRKRRRPRLQLRLPAGCSCRHFPAADLNWTSVLPALRSSMTAATPFSDRGRRAKSVRDTRFLLSQFAFNIFVELVDHAGNFRFHLVRRRTALELLFQRIEQQLLLASLAR